MKAYELAKAEIGTVEKAGKESNPKVVAYYHDAGHPEVKDDAVAWCAAFVGAMIKRAGGKPSGSLAARSYLKWGSPVDRQKAQEGDVVVFKRGNSDWQGHVAFFVKDNGSTITVLGGNQADAVNRRAYPAASLLGIRREVAAVAPKPAPQPASAPPVAPIVPTAPAPRFSIIALLRAAMALLLGKK